MSIAELGGDGGGAITAEWVELDGVRYPLQRPGQIQLRPMAPFAPAGALGDPTRPPLDPRLASITLIGSDLTGGLGVRDLDESQGITTYRRGTLDTRFKNGVTMPPALTPLTPVPIALVNFDGTAPVHADYMAVATPVVVVWSPSRANVYTYNIGAATWTTNNFTITNLALFRSVIVAVRPGALGIATSADGVTWVQGDTSNWAGLAAMDNLLWSFRTTDNTVYACTDPTQNIGVGGGWVVQGQPLIMLTGETPRQLVAWRDRAGEPALYLLTTHRIVGYDRASGNWVDFEEAARFRSRAQATYPEAHVWMRDGQMYATLFGAPGYANRYILQYTGNVNEVGPTGRGGLDATAFQKPALVRGDQHWLFCWFFGGGTLAAPGGVWAMNEFGGWHPIYDASEMAETTWVVGGGVYGDTLYVVHADGNFYQLTVYDSALPPYRLSNTTQAGTASLVTGRTTCGRPNQWKIGQYLYVDCERVDGTEGLAANSQLLIDYALEGATAFTRIGAYTSADTFPKFIPLPDTGQAGLAFRKLALQASLVKQNATDEPGVLRELTLYYTPWTQQKYGYVCNLDLRREGWGEGPLPDYDGLTIQNLWDKLFDPVTGLANKKGHISFAYGAADWAVTVAATDLLAAATTDPGAGGGVVQVTLRDLTLPSG